MSNLATVRTEHASTLELLADFIPVIAPTLVHSELGSAIYNTWLPEALAAGQMKCKPDPLVFGRGLDRIQGALDRWKDGVSAQKIVVELP